MNYLGMPTGTHKHDKPGHKLQLEADAAIADNDSANLKTVTLVKRRKGVTTCHSQGVGDDKTTPVKRATKVKPKARSKPGSSQNKGDDSVVLQSKSVERSQNTVLLASTQAAI